MFLENHWFGQLLCGPVTMFYTKARRKKSFFCKLKDFKWVLVGWLVNECPVFSDYWPHMTLNQNPLHDLF